MGSFSLIFKTSLFSFVRKSIKLKILPAFNDDRVALIGKEDDN